MLDFNYLVVSDFCFSRFISFLQSSGIFLESSWYIMVIGCSWTNGLTLPGCWGAIGSQSNNAPHCCTSRGSHRTWTYHDHSLSWGHRADAGGMKPGGWNRSFLSGFIAMLGSELVHIWSPWVGEMIPISMPQSSRGTNLVLGGSSPQNSGFDCPFGQPFHSPWGNIGSHVFKSWWEENHNRTRHRNA